MRPDVNFSCLKEFSRNWCFITQQKTKKSRKFLKQVDLMHAWNIVLLLVIYFSLVLNFNNSFCLRCVFCWRPHTPCVCVLRYANVRQPVVSLAVSRSTTHTAALCQNLWVLPADVPLSKTSQKEADMSHLQGITFMSWMREACLKSAIFPFLPVYTGICGGK